MRVLLIGAAALALAACGQGANQAGQSADAGGAGGAFPNLFQTAYRAEATTNPTDGVSTTIVMIRDGRKMRMEFAGPTGPVATILDPDAQVAYTLMPSQRTAMRIPLDQVMEQSPEEQWNEDLQGGGATRVGDCNVAGESGQAWRKTDEAGETSEACVTGDGILLRAQQGERVVWETTSVQRGPQAAENFVVPEGYNVMDMGALMDSAKGMMEQLKQRQGAGQ